MPFTPATAWAVCLAACACAALGAEPAATEETVFDFRPRIALADAAEEPGPPEDRAGERDVHLHVYERPVSAKLTAQNCRDARTPLDAPQVGVVLSGGISKGLAFVGALDVIDRVGIRVDKIAGTSMGAVIGAFYAAGYAPAQLYMSEEQRAYAAGRPADILGSINWRTLFTDIPDTRSLTLNQQISWGLGEGSTALPRVYQGGLRSGQNLSTLLGKYLLAASAASDGCFDNLYVPFVAKATNVLEARSETLFEGELATAVRASLSFPAMLTPTFIDGRRYIDGGILNNYALDAILEPRVKPEPGKQRPALPPFSVILGFDVSDTTVPGLPPPTLVPGKSLLGAITAIDDAIGAAISRETKAQIAELKACGRLPPLSHEKACLINVKVEAQGGFTDFARPQIDAFVRNGRRQAILGLCLQFVAADDEGCRAMGADRDDGAWSRRPALQRRHLEDRAIAQIRDSLFNQHERRWRFMLHNPQSTLDRARSDSRLNHGLLFRLRDLAKALGNDDTAEPKDLQRAEGDWSGALQGLQITLGEYGALGLQASPGVRDNPALRLKLIADLRRSVAWLLQELNRPVCKTDPCLSTGSARLPSFAALSGIRITRRGDVITLRASTWNYQVDGLLASNGLTERGALGHATLDFWNVPPGAADERVRKLDDSFCRRVRYDDPRCLPGSLQLGSQASPDQRSISYALSNEDPAPVARPATRWKHEIFEALDKKLLDVRYRPGPDPACDRDAGKAGPGGEPSLPYLFECLQERYYSNAAAEYFRIDAIRPGLLEIAEKDTSRTAAGSIFASYQYDYNNKHSFGLKHVYETSRDSWYEPTRVITSLAANEPFAEIAGMRLLDMKLLYYPSIRPLAPDYSFNPYIARRNQRIGERLSYLQYRDTGLNATASWRPAMTIGRTANYWTPYLGASVRRIGRFKTDDIERTRARLRDDGLGDDQRTFRSLSGGARAVQYLERGSLLEQFHTALHRANSRTYAEASLDLSAEAPVGPASDASLVGLRIFLGLLQPTRGRSAEDAAHAPPSDELYSLGGYFPLAERNLWGRKRIDYLGAEINERWGTRVALVEGRYSLWRWTPVSYFAPYGRVQIDAVAQSAQIGFHDDPSRRWRMASGVVGSVYFPSVASLKARLNAAIGGESLKTLRFFSSCELLF